MFVFKLHYSTKCFVFTQCFWPPQVYIVYFGEHSGENTLNEIKDTHHSYLLSVKKNVEEARSSLIYSYKHSINGFAALLTPEEASQLSGKQKHHMSLFPIINLSFWYIYLILKQWFWTELEEVVSVYQSNPKKYSLHTTRSWEFLGLDTKPKYPWSGGDLLSKAKYGEEVIVGVLDSGTYQFQFKLEFIYFWPRYCLTCENTTIIFVV